MNVLMVASENDGIASCKVGGIGDVIRDVPVALSQAGCSVSVITPSYGYLHETPGSEHVETFRFCYGGKKHQADLFKVRPRNAARAQTTHYVIEHSSFLHYNQGNEEYDIYSHGDTDRPFAEDASKFACFSRAVAAILKLDVLGKIDILHLHDWHASFLLMLKQFDPSCAHLNDYRTVFTIHNLAMQGIRPFEDNDSSFATWYPQIERTDEVMQTLGDPRWPDCINPMASGIRLADMVHTVSPSYASEIQKASYPPRYFGGEGLEGDIQTAMNEGRLHGILNGCEYDNRPIVKRTSHADLIRSLKKDSAQRSARRITPNFSDLLAFSRLEQLEDTDQKYSTVLTSVSRIVDQKMLLLRARGSDGKTGLEKILELLGDKGVFILLGSGDSSLEEYLTVASAMHKNFVFLNNYCDPLAEMLYANGDMFLMPNSFEPCGTCQMFAMRAGQPCIVHQTGGLRDTINSGVNGFSFTGVTLSDQVDAMSSMLKDTLDMRFSNPEKWTQICNAASETRFSWSCSAELYIEKLYTV